MTLFTVVPLLIVVYYAFTDGNGAFTMETRYCRPAEFEQKYGAA